MGTFINPTQSELVTEALALAAGASTLTLISAPPVGQSKLYRLWYYSQTSAAQAITIAAGSQTVLTLAASVTAHAIIDTGWLDNGIELTEATALIATPAAAGPAGTFFVTYTRP